MNHHLSKLLKSLTAGNVAAGVVKYRVATLAGVMALTVIFTVCLPRLTIRTSVYDLVIEDLPEYAEYNGFKALFGNEEIIRVVVKGENIFDPSVFEKIAALSAATRAVEGVRRVISLPEIKKTVDPTGQWSFERFQAFVGDVPLFQRNLISGDKKTTAITLVLADNAEPDRVIRAVQAILDHAGTNLTLYQIGMPLISKALGEFTTRDFMQLPPLTFLVIAGMLLLLLCSLRYVLVTLACVSLALVWTFGLAAISAIPLSMLTMIVPVFLIAVGTAYCLHIIAVHRQVALKSGVTAAGAVLQTFATMAFPSILAVATTVLSLCSLFLSHITAIHQFAAFACSGMFSFLAILITFLPAALSYTKPTPERHKLAAAPLQRLIDAIITLHLKHQKKALFIMGGIALFCIAGLFQLRVETNPVKFFKQDSEVRQHFHDIYQHLSGSFPIHLTMAGPEDDFFENLENITAVEKIQQYAESLAGVDKSISFADYLKLVNYVSNRFEPTFYRLPTEGWELRMLINTFRSWLGLELSMATSLIASVAIGLAVDDTIHYMVRFNREFRKDLDERRAMRHTLQHMGQPILITTLTISLGFSILLLSSFRPTTIFGLMMVITMLSALAGDLILLPALMQRVELVTLWDLVRIKMGRNPEFEIPLFKGLSRTEMHSVMMAGTLVKVREREMLFQKGETSETMYAVISGSFDVFDYESDHEAAFRHGIKTKIGYCRAGEILGEMGLLRSVPRSATVVAVEDSELLMINWKVIQRLQWLYPPVAVKFFRNLTAILSNRVERLTHSLAKSSTIDDLTGIFNRTGFCRILEREVKHAIRYQEQVCLGMLDLDFNGVQPGCEEDLRCTVIQSLAQTWRRIIRKCDTIGRISVQRFVLLLPRLEKTDMQKVRERMQAAARGIHGQFCAPGFSLQISMLNMTFKEDSEAEGEVLLNKALEAFTDGVRHDEPAGGHPRPHL